MSNLKITVQQTELKKVGIGHYHSLIRPAHELGCPKKILIATYHRSMISEKMIEDLKDCLFFNLIIPVHIPGTKQFSKKVKYQFPDYENDRQHQELDLIQILSLTLCLHELSRNGIYIKLEPEMIYVINNLAYVNLMNCDFSPLHTLQGCERLFIEMINRLYSQNLAIVTYTALINLILRKLDYHNNQLDPPYLSIIKDIIQQKEQFVNIYNGNSYIYLIKPTWNIKFNSNEREIVLKAPKSTQDQLLSQREVQISQLLKHDNFFIGYLQILDQTYLFFNKRITLSEYSQHQIQNQPIEIKKQRIHWILEQLMYKLQNNHQKTILHRDLKPANIYVDKLENPTELIIADYDNSKIKYESNIKITEFNEKTFEYAAPEVIIDHQKQDFQSDIWQAALIIYELGSELSIIRNNHNIALADNQNQKYEEYYSNGEILKALKEYDFKYLIADCLRRNPIKRPSISDILNQIQRLGTNNQRVQSIQTCQQKSEIRFSTMK